MRAAYMKCSADTEIWLDRRRGKVKYRLTALPVPEVRTGPLVGNVFHCVLHEQDRKCPQSGKCLAVWRTHCNQDTRTGNLAR